MPTLPWIILIVVGGGVLWLILAYNGLIRSRTRTEEAWSDIEVQLKRRYDLIPNLIETVKGYAKHEAGVFLKVTQARQAAMNATTLGEHVAAENMLTNTLKSLFAVAENYPDLKASSNFLQLQDELSDTENKIQAARRFYNANVRDYNIQQQVFPTNLITGVFRFQQKEFFELNDEKEASNIAVKF